MYEYLHLNRDYTCNIGVMASSSQTKILLLKLEKNPSILQ